MTGTRPRLTRRRLLQAVFAGTTTASLFWGSGYAAFARQAASVRRTRAVLVGIGPYPFLPDVRQLTGATEDVRRMKLLMPLLSGGAGKPDDTVLLENENATAVNVRAALQAVLEKTGPGDGVTFYWSGRGSLRPAATGEEAAKNAEPTLVPHDGQENSGAGDIGLDEIAAWAQKAVQACGATENVLVVVDASFYAPPSRDGGIRQGRVVNPEPRCIVRAGLRPRRALWQGAESAGVFLCAAGSGGLAHEEQPVVGKWHGIFTDRFVLQTTADLQNHRVPTPTEFLTHLAQWSVGKGLDDWKPYPSLPSAEKGGEDALAAADLGSAYRKPLLGISPERVGSVVQQNAPVQSEVQMQAKARQEREKWLRFAVSVGVPAADGGSPTDNSADNAAAAPSEAFAALLAEVRNGLQKVSPAYAVLLPPQVGPVDRMVEVDFKADGAYQVRVTGVERDALTFGEGIVAPNRSALTQTLDEVIAPYLRVQALTKRLYFLGEKANRTDAMRQLTVAHADKSKNPVKEPVFHAGDYFGLRVTTSRAGWLFCLEQWGQEGLVQMVWPLPYDPSNGVVPDALRLIPDGSPHHFGKAWQILDKIPTGTVNLRLMLVSPQAGMPDLPPLPDNLLGNVSSGDLSEEKAKKLRDAAPAWNRALSVHLEAAVSALEKNNAGLSVHDYVYEIRPQQTPLRRLDVTL